MGRFTASGSGSPTISTSPDPVNASPAGVTYTARGSIRGMTSGRSICLKLREYQEGESSDTLVGLGPAVRDHERVVADVPDAHLHDASRPAATSTRSSSRPCAGSAGEIFYVDGLSVSEPGSPTVPALPEVQGDPVLLGLGDIASCWANGDEATARLLDTTPGVIGIAGDTEQNHGEPGEFQGCYDPPWGRHKWRTKPAVGDHEYGTTGAAGLLLLLRLRRRAERQGLVQLRPRQLAPRGAEQQLRADRRLRPRLRAVRVAPAGPRGERRKLRGRLLAPPALERRRHPRLAHEVGPVLGAALRVRRRVRLQRQRPHLPALRAPDARRAGGQRARHAPVRGRRGRHAALPAERAAGQHAGAEHRDVRRPQAHASRRQLRVEVPAPGRAHVHRLRHHRLLAARQDRARHRDRLRPQRPRPRPRPRASASPRRPARRSSASSTPAPGRPAPRRARSPAWRRASTPSACAPPTRPATPTPPRPCAPGPSTPSRPTPRSAPGPAGSPPPRPRASGSPRRQARRSSASSTPAPGRAAPPRARSPGSRRETHTLPRPRHRRRRQHRRHRGRAHLDRRHASRPTPRSAPGPAAPRPPPRRASASTPTTTPRRSSASSTPAPGRACTSPRALTGLAQGDHTFRVRATDAAGNTDATEATRTWTVDTVAPDTTIGSGPSGPTASAAASFAFSSSETGSTFECRLDAGAWQSCTSPRALSALAQGAHTFRVRATDAAGNVDATEATRTWTVDTVAPETTIESGPSGTVASASASVGFDSDDDAATFECKLDSGAWQTCTSPRAPHRARARAATRSACAPPTPPATPTPPRRRAPGPSTPSRPTPPSPAGPPGSWPPARPA